MRDLILTGFMGTGKSTVGRLAAHRFGLTLLDTDEEVERRAGCSVAEIFAKQGEGTFRRLETEVLEGLSEGEGRVIATGGGTFVSEHNRTLIGSDQAVVCLSCDVSELERRLAGATDRPLLKAGGGEIATLLASRSESYRHFPQVDTTGKTPDQVVDEIAALVDPHYAAELSITQNPCTRLIFDRGAARAIGQLLLVHGLMGAVLVVTDETVASLGLLGSVLSSFSQVGVNAQPAVLPSGEKHKTLQTLEHLYGVCMERGLDRDAIVVGLGGGVVCDVAGLLAATYLRGVRLVLAPTTLVAQADAAIGGKVAVDFRGAKNIVGAFHPASLVVLDPDLLATLPPARMADGLAEIVKIAAVRSASLLGMVEQLASPVAVLLNPAIVRQAAIEKTRVVQRDPYERGERAMLNFGHTIGHAVEAASRYRLAHGQAVSVGMVAETWLAEKLGICPPGLLARLARILSRFDLPLQAPGLQPDVILSYLHHDKKRMQAAARFALPTGPGEGAVFPIAEADVCAAIRRVSGGKL